MSNDAACWTPNISGTNAADFLNLKHCDPGDRRDVPTTVSVSPCTGQGLGIHIPVSRTTHRGGDGDGQQAGWAGVLGEGVPGVRGGSADEWPGIWRGRQSPLAPDVDVRSLPYTAPSMYCTRLGSSVARAPARLQAPGPTAVCDLLTAACFI